MNVKLFHDFTNIAASPFEVVERKGRGHPDTLADRLAETLSITYSRYTLTTYGAVLRHQFDKLSLMGGKCEVRFGDGHFRSPIRLLINGRVTSSFAGNTVECRDRLIGAAASFLQRELRNFDFTIDCRVMWEATSNRTRGVIDHTLKGTSAIHHRFNPRNLMDLPESSRPLANDTAVGCGWAPYTPLEQMILDVERSLTSDESWSRHPWMGADCKIMGYRNGRNALLTVAIPQLCTEVKSRVQYEENVGKVRGMIEKCVKAFPFESVTVDLNTGDYTDNEMFYLSYTGSCIESGDEGQVSRGNRLGGVISSRRPFSVEGLSGKNPAYHAGKIYSVAAWQIANDIWQSSKVPCEVFIISQIDRPLDDPWVVLINSAEDIEANEIHRVVSQVIGSISQVTTKLLDGAYPLV